MRRILPHGNVASNRKTDEMYKHERPRLRAHKHTVGSGKILRLEERIHLGCSLSAANGLDPGQKRSIIPLLAAEIRWAAFLSSLFGTVVRSSAYYRVTTASIRDKAPRRRIQALLVEKNKVGQKEV